MSDCVAAVIVAAYIYLMFKGRHTGSGIFFIGILSLLAIFIARAIAAGNAEDYSIVKGVGVFVEICMGVAFLCLVICLPRENMDNRASDEVKNVLGNALKKAAENAENSETNEE